MPSILNINKKNIKKVRLIIKIIVINFFLKNFAPLNTKNNEGIIKIKKRGKSEKFLM